MKLKKILAALAASAALVCSTAIGSFAANDGEAAYCFDNSNKLTDWQTYGSAEDVSFKFTSTSAKSKNGNGSLLVSENFTENIENGFGGAYIDAETLNLDNFGGCTITMSVLLAEGAEDHCENLALYSDGIIWLNQPAVGLSTETWTDVSLTIPEDADNNMIGFTIPTFAPYSGDIAYIDDLTITFADGTSVANLGDYQQKTLTGENTVSTGKNIALTILLVVLILAIVGGIGLIISAIMKKFA